MRRDEDMSEKQRGRGREEKEREGEDEVLRWDIFSLQVV